VAAFLFTIYLIAGCYCITRIRFIKDSGLGGRAILMLFLVKIIAGLALGLANHFLLHDNTDYNKYHAQGLTEYYNLFHRPHEFFTDIFRSNYPRRGNFFGSIASYWNDLGSNILLKFIGCADIFSRGNYYINSLFFNFCCFFGHIALYRVFINIFPKSKWPVLIGCFLVPSMLYFSSGIHKDGLIFTSLAIFCYAVYFSFDCGFSRKRILLICASFLMILLVRNFIAVFLLPCAIGWFISRRYRMNAVLVFTSMFILLAAGIALLHYYQPAHDPLQTVVARQHEFLYTGSGRTQYNNDTLVPTLKSFIVAAPTALGHSYLTPYPGEFVNLFMNLFSAEMIAYWLLLILFIFYRHRKVARENEFIVFAYCFTFIVFLFTGYIATAAGALIRYRSIYLPFIFTPLLACIRWRRGQSGKTQQ